MDNLILLLIAIGVFRSIAKISEKRVKKQKNHKNRGIGNLRLDFEEFMKSIEEKTEVSLSKSVKEYEEKGKEKKAADVLAAEKHRKEQDKIFERSISTKKKYKETEAYKEREKEPFILEEIDKKYSLSQKMIIYSEILSPPKSLRK